MSRIVRRQLFEMMDTLQTATDMLEGLFAYDSGEVSYEELVELLADCQNCAITVGNKIEAVYGTETKSVAMLEAYCESIYEMSQNLEEITQSLQHYNNAKEQVKAVISHMEQEIPDKKEILFLPYKASMWDSLESVYLAVREDEECEAYVVPIPYFDRKSDKTLGQMHYEGNEYPVNIPVTDWEQYSIEERCPDVIYIHNAYDDMNLVTCVHPKFFSSNIKNYTDELIYIPYFVLEEIEPDDQVKIDNMKHFCVLPGIINADKVILQSEKMSQIYINEYTKAFEAAGASVDREQLKQKFLGLGSPKFDKVLNTKKEDVEIPAEWLKVIQKPDETLKKIIFYNTSVTALLKHEEKMLHKMKNVFEVFKERQDEVALLWRPHPLIRTTIEAMRPQLWLEYEQIVEQYKSEGWGIYDDTADMDRAIALSDGYYGDQSSVIQLCQKAGVPVMVQDVSVRENDENNEFKVEIEDAALVDNVLWFCTTNFKTLFSKNIDTGEMECFDIPSGTSRGNRYMFATMEIVGRKIYLIPLFERAIMCFDIEKKVFQKIGIREDIIRDKKALFFGTAVYEHYIFIMGFHVPAILRLNVENNHIDYITDWFDAADKLIFDFADAYFGKQSVLLEDKVFVPFCNANAILEIDCVSLKTYIHRIGLEKQGYSGVCHDAEVLWLSPRKNGSLVGWNVKTREVRKINLSGLEDGFSYIGIALINNAINLFSTMNNLICVWADNVLERPGKYSFVSGNKNKVAFYEREKGVVSIIQPQTQKQTDIKISLRDGDVNMRRFFEDRQGDSEALVELEEVKLRHFISYIQEMYVELRR